MTGNGYTGGVASRQAGKQASKQDKSMAGDYERAEFQASVIRLGRGAHVGDKEESEMRLVSRCLVG